MTQFDQRYQHVETQYNADQITIQQQPLSLTEKQRKQNRTRMLDRVQTIWIKGVLEPSAQGAAQIALELERKPSATVTPLWQEVRAFDTTGRLSSAQSSIVQVYDHANGEVLILGEPGAGKTTLLLELTHDLLQRARQDETHPIPVVFSLSSWATRRQPLTEWLASELHSRYQVPLPLAASWIETDQVLPLLDGLDEVAALHRAACVEAINTYRQAHGLLPTVVCSRQTDYLALSTRLLLRTAVVVQPLTSEQIESYLESVGEQAEALHTVLRQDADLRELATTPLMLTILLFAYKGTSADKISELTSLGAKREQLFASYMQHMLKRRGASKRYQPEQITHWLTCLARQMKRQNQTLFYLEQMQPDWLSDNRMLGVYNWVAVRLPDVLMGMLVILIINMFFNSYSDLLGLIPDVLLGGLLGGLLSEGSIPQRSTVSGGKARSALGPRLLQWLLIGVLIGFGSDLSSGLSLGLSSGPNTGLSDVLGLGLDTGLSYGIYSVLLQFLLRKNSTAETRSQTSPPARGTAWQHLIRRREVHNGLLVGLIIGLLSWLSNTLFDGLNTDLSTGLGNWLTFGLGAWGLSILLIGRSTAIQPTDLLIWSRRSLGKSLFSKSHTSTTVRITALIGLIYGLGNWLSLWPNNDLSSGLSVMLSTGLSIGLSYWLLLGLSRGVSGATIEDQRRMVPNQGIRRSALNGLVFGLISAVIVGPLGLLSTVLSLGLWDVLSYGLSKGLSKGLSTGLSIGLPTGLLAGLSAGLLVGLLNGGLASFRHYVLRFLLWRTGAVPWHYVPFLDYAAERILLRKVGGGYLFLHRLLLDYFADLETEPGSDETKESGQERLHPDAMPSVSVEPTGGDEHSDVLAVPLAPTSLLSDIPRLLPCGHELRTPSARFCSVCGASLTMPHTPT
jgi:hypothetical protein